MDTTAPIGMIDEFNPLDRRIMDTAYCEAIIKERTASVQAVITAASIDPKALQVLHNIVLTKLRPLQRLALNKPVNKAKPSHDNVIRASVALSMITAQYEKIAQAERGINPGGGTQINIQIVAPAPVTPEIVDAEFRLKE